MKKKNHEHTTAGEVVRVNSRGRGANVEHWARIELSRWEDAPAEEPKFIMRLMSPEDFELYKSQIKGNKPYESGCTRRMYFYDGGYTLDRTILTQ